MLSSCWTGWNFKALNTHGEKKKQHKPMYHDTSAHIWRFSSMTLEAGLQKCLWWSTAMITGQQAGCGDLWVAEACTPHHWCHTSKPHSKLIQPARQEGRHLPAACPTCMLPAAELQSLPCFLLETVTVFRTRSCISKHCLGIRDLALDVVAALPWHVQ